VGALLVLLLLLHMLQRLLLLLGSLMFCLHGLVGGLLGLVFGHLGSLIFCLDMALWAAFSAASYSAVMASNSLSQRSKTSSVNIPINRKK
jgi:hypothetical protein